MTRVKVVRDILEANDRLARENRRRFDDAGVRVLNLMSAPGAGKTTLLEETIAGSDLRIGVIEGDIQGSQDAERIDNAGARSVQINTDGACHLDANMVASAVTALGLEDLDLLVIENVGNLVCPAEFNVGEHAKAMLRCNFKAIHQLSLPKRYYAIALARVAWGYLPESVRNAARPGLSPVASSPRSRSRGWRSAGMLTHVSW